MFDQRGWKRLEWKMIEERKLAWFDFEDGFCGAVKMLKVSEPFKVGKKELVICDTGITWVQCAWKNKDIWATAMFDQKGHLFQIYFDVAYVHLDGEASGFTDLIVDVVYDPDGTSVVLDQNELDEMHQKGLISLEDKQHILGVSKCLKNELESHFEQVNSWFEMMYEKVKKIL